MKNRKKQWIKRICENYIKNLVFRWGRNSIFTTESRKSAKNSPSITPDRGKKGVKTALFGEFFSGKCNIISLIHSKLKKKIEKSEKKWVACAVCVGKNLFLQSQTTTIWGARKEGLSTGECSLKEWRNVANTQVRNFEIRKRRGQDRQHKIKDINYYGEFDPGSGWTLAAGLIHASRTVRPSAAMHEVHEWRTGA